MITLVCGFPRSGSSLMMRMLHRGGIPMYGDSVSGEHDDVMKLYGGDCSWMKGLDGRCIKILDPQNFPVPRAELLGTEYQIVWMNRNPAQQAKSQLKFMRACFPGSRFDSAAIPKIAKSLIDDYPKVTAGIKALTKRYVEVSFESLIQNPQREIERLQDIFVGITHPERMAEEIILRGPECLPYVLELKQITDAQK